MPSWLAHPAFEPYAGWLAALPGDEPPDVGSLERRARERSLSLPNGLPVRIVAAGARLAALAFERRLHGAGLLGVRQGSWHDAFNVLAWMAFPRLKAALNACHVRDGEAATANRRTPARDAATLVDESGLVVGCSEPELARLLRARAWRQLFVARRADLRRHFVPCVVGHGLLDRLRAPYRALTAHVLVVPVSCGPVAAQALDAAAAAIVAAEGFDKRALVPLPVAALPGWDVERLGDALFDDASVFRASGATLASRAPDMPGTSASRR